MTTRYCPECGAEYVASVTQCVDCLVPLRDDVEADRARERAPAAALPEEGEQTVYELEDWDPDRRVTLARILVSEEIPHAWEATDLVIRQGDEARVEAIMDDIDQPIEVGLGEDGEQVVYELEDWNEEQRAALVALLEESAVPYAWDENGDLTVEDADAEEVERLLDQVEFPDALPEEQDDSGQGQEVMSTLFVAADRLVHDPRVPEATIEAIEGAAAASGLALPYGFTKETWGRVVERAAALSDALQQDEDDDDVIAAATTLRELLRQYV